jgi:hypothetical protein
MGQLMLGFLRQERTVVRLQPHVEKAVMARMADMMVDLIKKQERRNDEPRTTQERGNDARQTDQQ